MYRKSFSLPLFKEISAGIKCLKGDIHNSSEQRKSDTYLKAIKLPSTTVMQI